MPNTIICQKIVSGIKEMLLCDDFISKFRTPGAFTRKRKLSMYQVILFLLYTSKRSMNLNLSNIRVDLHSLGFPAVSKQAVSKARKGILPELFLSLMHFVAETFYLLTDQRRSWHGYYPFAIDGSKIQVPGNRDTLSYFGSAHNDKARHRTAMAAASVLYDVSHDIIADALIHPFDHGERKAAGEHLAHLENMGLHKNAVILFDRGYHSFELMQHIDDKGYYFLERVQKNIHAFADVASDDEIIDYYPSYKKEAQIEPVTVRVLHVLLDDGSTEYLVTNLLSPAITPLMLKELYFQRWLVEGKYMELKSRWELEEFSGATHISVEQEFFINIMLSNLTAMIKADADKEIEQTRRPDNKYHYQANRANIIGHMKDFLPLMLCGEKAVAAQLEWIYGEALKGRSQIQPGRKSKRPRVQLKRKHFNNRKRCI